MIEQKQMEAFSRNQEFHCIESSQAFMTASSISENHEHVPSQSVTARDPSSLQLTPVHDIEGIDIVDRAYFPNMKQTDLKNSREIP